jgi:hypothetical protein
VLFLVGAFVELQIVSVVQLRSPSSTVAVSLNCVVAGAILIVVTVLPLCVAAAVHTAESQSRLYSVFEVLFEDLKKSKVCRYLYVVCLVHQYLCMSVVLLSSSPSAQIITCCALTVLVSSMQKLLYLAIARPFEDIMLVVSFIVGDLSVLASILAIGVGYYFAAYYAAMRYTVMACQLSIAAFNISYSVKNTVQMFLTKKPSRIELN